MSRAVVIGVLAALTWVAPVGARSSRIGLIESSLRAQDGTERWTLTDRMKHYRVTGASVAVIENFKIEWARGYGELAPGSGIAVDTETVFQASSLSKPLFAMAVLRLVEQGRLDLDADVNASLKSWRVPENEFTRRHPVTLRGLLSHTAGTTIGGFPGYFPGAILPTIPQVLDGLMPANTRAVRVDKLPGADFRYSGGGTTIAQLVVTDVTGESFAEYMHKAVLQPLGMNRSTYEHRLPARFQYNAARASGKDGTLMPGNGWFEFPEMAAAALWTTPSDFARYVIEVQLSAAGRSNKLISRRMTQQMLEPQAGGPVGLGPFITGAGDSRYFSHTGGNVGFPSAFVAYAATGQGAVVMLSGDNAMELRAEILRAIADVHGWKDFTP